MRSLRWTLLDGFLPRRGNGGQDYSMAFEEAYGKKADVSAKEGVSVAYAFIRNVLICLRADGIIVLRGEEDEDIRKAIYVSFCVKGAAAGRGGGHRGDDIYKVQDGIAWSCSRIVLLDRNGL